MSLTLVLEGLWKNLETVQLYSSSVLDVLMID